MPWKCFLVSPTTSAVVSLRRYSIDNACKLSRLGYHNAEVNIGEENFPGVLDGVGDQGPPRDYAKWPLTCECDYIFNPEDSWQRNLDRIYEGLRGHERIRVSHRNLPPGAMWSKEECRWLDNKRRGPDGKHWFVRLPGCVDWPFYGEGTNGHLWNVQGLPPDLTIHPSIDYQGVYHGWVGKQGTPPGYVSDDHNGRRFDENGKLLV